MFNLSGVKYMLCMFWCNSIGMFSFSGWQKTKVVCQDHFFFWHVLYCVIICFVSIITFFVIKGGAVSMGFSCIILIGLVIIVYCNVPAINICMKFF